MATNSILSGYSAHEYHYRVENDGEGVYYQKLANPIAWETRRGDPLLQRARSVGDAFASSYSSWSDSSLNFLLELSKRSLASQIEV